MGEKLRYFGSLFFSTIIRLVKFFPNNDPIMGCSLVFAKNSRLWKAILFPVIAMVVFDIITMKVGIWTFGTAAAFALIVVIFSRILKNRKSSLGLYAKSSIAGVLIFDFLTGPIMSSFAFKIPFEVALLGQIPFTIMHLGSALLFTTLIVPILDPEVKVSLRKMVSRDIAKIRMLFLRL
jgi:hypothetical protein